MFMKLIKILLCFIISALIVVVMPTAISLTELYPDMVTSGSGDATLKPLVHPYLRLPIWCHLTPGLRRVRKSAG